MFMVSEYNPETLFFAWMCNLTEFSPLHRGGQARSDLLEDRCGPRTSNASIHPGR